MSNGTGHPWLAEGLAIGLVGAVAVALWFLILGVVAGDLLLIPAGLGSMFLLNAMAPEEIRRTAGAIGGYAAVHLAVFGLAGLAVSWSASVLRRRPRLWLVWLLAFITLEGVFLGTVGGMAYAVLRETGWWAILLGNLIAVVVMGWRAWVAYPVARERVAHTPHPRL